MNTSGKLVLQGTLAHPIAAELQFPKTYKSPHLSPI
jgi:hypothetical protein